MKMANVSYPAKMTSMMGPSLGPATGAIRLTPLWLVRPTGTK